MSKVDCDFNLKSFENEDDKITLHINDYRIECSKTNLSKISPIALNYFDDNPKATDFKIEITKNEIQKDIIELIFQNKTIQINSQNDLFIYEFSSKLQIQSLEDISENWELYELQETESIVFDVDESILDSFSLNPETEEIGFEMTKVGKIKRKLQIVGRETFCRLIINACISRPKMVQVYLKLVQYLCIESTFCRVILSEMGSLDGVFSLRQQKVQIICYLVRYFYDHGLIKAKKIQSLYKNLPVFFADLSDNPLLVSKELRANDWFEFKKLASEGINPDPLSRIIRIDDIDTFQKVSSLPRFEFDEAIKPSEFECNDFINHRPCSYLECSAFFGSMKCFKYIYLNAESLKSDDLIKYAVAGGNSEIIRICERNESSNFKDTSEIAVKFHHWEVFEWLTENRYEKNNDQKISMSLDLFSYLYQCIQFSNFTTLLYLINKGADYNLALPIAIDLDNVLLTKWLFKHKEELFKLESSKSVIKSFLHFACRNENVEMLNLLLTEKDYCNINSRYEGKTPLIIAIEKENYQLYEILIRQPEIKLDIRDFSGKQAIHFACEHKNTEILENLLENKINEIDVNRCDKNGNTPLLLACEKGNINIIRVLFKYCQMNLELDVKNNLDFNLFITACLAKKKKKRLPIIQLLYEKINNHKDKEYMINEKGPMNKTLLHFACENKEIEIVRYLLSLPLIQINSVDCDNRTPLISSVIIGCKEIIELLLGHKEINLTIKDKNQRTAYDIAVINHLDSEIIQKLRQ